MALVILDPDDLRAHGWIISEDGCTLALGGVVIRLVYPYPQQPLLVVNEEDVGAFSDVGKELTSRCRFCCNVGDCPEADDLEHPECFEV